jgi:signal transduction histidine kinase
METGRNAGKSQGAALSARTRNSLVFFLALFLLTLGAVLTYRVVFQLIDAQRWVGHTRDVQAALSNISTVSSRAGGRRLEYVHNGDGSRLIEYQAAVNQMLNAVSLVRSLTADNELQQKNCSELESLVRRRIDLMNQSIDQRRSGKFDLQSEAQFTQAIVQTASLMDSQILQMGRLEGELLVERERRSQVLFRREVILITVAFLIAVLLLSLHYYLLNQELKGRQRAEESLRKLNSRLLEMQDAERRRISRELHESIAQYLSGVKMSLEVVRKSIPQNALLAECVSILDKSIAETRTISQLLHPPILDDIGFASAARWYVEGFSERGGIHVQLNLPENLKRLPGPVELALFRVLQESLTNVRWHSGSQKAEVSVSLTAHEVVMRVRDYGKGMSQAMMDKLQSNGSDLGLGISGMKERLRELGGRLEIHSDSSGTEVEAVLPIAETALPSDDRSRLEREIT